MVKKSIGKCAALAALMMGTALTGVAQQPGTNNPPAAVPNRPGPQVATPAAKPFPPANLKNFTADSPTKNDVDAFLTTLWGYEPNRIWQVMGIQKTPAPGVSKITVLIADKSQPGKNASTVFFTTADGRHAVAGDKVIDFGAKPFADTRATLQAQADGAARGAAGKELMLVEFADLQCPHCREAQATMDSLAQDFPQARIVFENFPLQEIHPFATEAAEMGECVRRSKGDAAFFTYAQTVYDSQDGLTAERGGSTLNAAIAKAGADPSGVRTCAATPAVREAVASQARLGTSIGVDQTPMLSINGNLLPLGSVPYETLKKMVAFRAGQDGIAVQVQPSLTTLK